ncbi:MAG: 5-formyltetrahydrofolate cyclo-ligase [Prevotella sp.]|nr:5-formyltetrahydrofolate cyclo-ligase [Prevotella sp.]
MKRPAIQIPEGVTEVLLHACCAPCSSAIVEWLVGHGVQLTIFYYNPNIWPREEYEIRKNESKRHAESLGIRWIDGDYNHEAWQQGICGLEGEPERGRRCEQCFRLRLTRAAQQARELGLAYFATTLASSRWKSLEQIERAGHWAEQAVPGVTFWAQNWRKGGLYERRNQLLKAYGFYNQQYCGCEFSAGQAVQSKAGLRRRMRELKRQHAAQLPEMSRQIVEALRCRLKDAEVVMAYWPLPDEADIRSLVDLLVAEGKTVLLPKVVDDTAMELRQYLSADDLREGAFRVMEPTGMPYTDYARIDVALVPGVAFDAAGHRLGRGRGYYDRFLAAHPRMRSLGVCFPFQRVASVPVDEHDVAVDEVL